MECNKENLQTTLYQRVEVEQEAWVSDLLKESKEDILSASYEKVVRDNLLSIIENEDLDDQTVYALLSLDYPLAHCYNMWCQSDPLDSDLFRKVIEYAATII